MKILLRKALVGAFCMVFAIGGGVGTVFAASTNAIARADGGMPDKASGEADFSKDAFVQSLQALLAEGSLSDAILLFDELPQEMAGDTDLSFLKAALLVSAERYAEARTICVDLQKKEPQNVDVLSLSATIAKALGDSRERDKQLKALLAIDAYNPDANIGLADDAFSRKNYKQSRLYYQKALVREPQNEEAMFGVGRASYYLEDDSKAEDMFKRILERDPTYAPAYSYLGKLAVAHNEFVVAANYAKQAVALDASNYDYIMDYGMYERYQGHYDNAILAWTKAISLQPDYFLAYAYRAGLYDETNKFSEALQDYLMVVKLNPEYYYAYESLGVLALHEENWTEARKAFLKCYEYNKENISYPLMVTYCYYKEKDTVNAKKFSDSVLRKLDRSSIEYAMLRVYHDLAGAMPLPQRIAAIQSTNKRGKMYFYLGLLYDMMGGSEASKGYFMEVIKMNSPQFFEYRLAEWSVALDESN